MPPNIPALVAAALILYLIADCIAKWTARRKFIRSNGLKPVPCYQPKSFLGMHLFKEAKAAVESHKGLQNNVDRFAKFGNTYSAEMIGKKLIMTIDPENVKALLATSFDDFGLGHRLLAFGPFIGRGIFTSDGAHWEHSRGLIRPNFNRSQLADIDMFEHHIQDLISLIPTDGSSVDLQPLFFNLTLDSATEFLVGKSVNCQLAAEGSKARAIAEAFNYAEGQMSIRLRLGKLAFLYRNAKFTESCRLVHEFFDEFITEAMNSKKYHERYVFVRELMKHTRNLEQLRNEALNVLIAGRDTTAGLLSNTFHALARHPRVWEKLQQEVAKLKGERPDYAYLRGEMPYLKAVLNEGLRLYPSVPANTRFANRDTTLPRGGGDLKDSPILVPKGTIVMYSVYAMQRRKDIYGPDADEFRPERWLSDNPAGPLRPGWGFLPFNGGPRICIGQQYALTEAAYTVVRLLQTFKGLENRDKNPWEEHLGVTLSSRHGTNVGLTYR